MTDNDQIREAVKERYATLARSVPVVQPVQSCCGDETEDAGCGSKLYDATLLQDLPVDVTGFSLGCGDPVTVASLNPGETVLDLGSGGGLDCFLAAKQVGPTGRVIGIDMTDEMLARANAKRDEMGLAQVEFRKGQIEQLPVEDNTVDVVMSNCVINLSPDKAAVFSEVFRVLKPGGRAAISDIVTEGEFSEELRADLARWSECVTGAIDAAAYTGLMRAAGFVDVAIVDRVETGEDVVQSQAGMPRLYSARITARKPV